LLSPVPALAGSSIRYPPVCPLTEDSVPEIGKLKLHILTNSFSKYGDIKFQVIVPVTKTSEPY
jgi:hypothetical protein